MNTIGTILRFTDFGESHGAAVGGVIDGFPSGIDIDYDDIDRRLARRRPGGGAGVSSRQEADRVRFLSGIFEGKSLGTPIAFIIENTDARPADYSEIARKFRPGHADYTYFAKYGHRDYRGGGRASARETAARVVAGALADHILAKAGISIEAWAESIGDVVIETPADIARAEEAMREARANHDTLGGIVRCRIKGVPPGLGEPVFGKLQARLAAAMMSINAAKGFEYGDGFAMAAVKGSEVVDEFASEGGRIYTRTNHSGGIQGGISNGNDITMRVAFKPVATMPVPLNTVDEDGNATVVEVGGRHDVCVVPRAVAVVEAMAALVMADALLVAKAY